MPRDRTRATLDSAARISLAGLPLNNGRGCEGTWRIGSLVVIGRIVLCDDFGALKLSFDGQELLIRLEAQRRNYGSKRWYLRCPRTVERVTVLWKPQSAGVFASRHAWSAVYFSKSIGPVDRAWRTKRRVAQRLGSADPHDYDLPDKPKRMRWTTYDRYVAHYERAEERLNDGLCEVVARLCGKRVSPTYFGFKN